MLRFNNKLIRVNGSLAGEVIIPPEPPVDPYNPLGLPANTIRCKFKSGYTPDMGDTRTIVDSTNNVWDIYKQSNDWNSFFMDNSNLLEVLGANTSNVTVMWNMLYGCGSLISVALFDTSNITDMWMMFYECGNLTSIPLFDTSKVTDMSYTFQDCYKVESGALALYQQASSQANPPSTHPKTFRNCGSETQTGAAELAQIPSDWK